MRGHVPLEAYNYQNWKLREPRGAITAWVCDLSFEPRLDTRRAGSSWTTMPPSSRAERPPVSCCTTLRRSGRVESAMICAASKRTDRPSLTGWSTSTTSPICTSTQTTNFRWPWITPNLVKTYHFWYLLALVEGKFEALFDHPLLEVMAVKRRVEDPLGYEWCAKNVVRLSPLAGYVPTIIGNNNIIAHQLLERKATPFGVMVTLFKKANNTVVASLRSRQARRWFWRRSCKGRRSPQCPSAYTLAALRRNQFDDAIRYLQKQVFDPAPAKDQPLNSLVQAFWIR